MLACAEPPPEGELLADLDGLRVLRLEHGFAAVRPGGLWEQADSLEGLSWVHYQQGYLYGRGEGLRLEPVEWPEVTVDGGEMRAMAPHGVLWGRARWPVAEGPHPVVIWLARDGGGMNDHPEAAEALAAQGFFVLTYDRRGLGNSRLWEADTLDLGSHADDLDDWLPFLEQHPMADHQRISLLGHGLGGRIAAIRPEASVSISGPGADRVADPDVDARGAWRTGDLSHGLSPSSMERLIEGLKAP